MELRAAERAAPDIDSLDFDLTVDGTQEDAFGC
jgi:hypothetical protein